MIISHITGGAGSQMFTYSAGRYLANKLNTELKLDVTRYTNRYTMPYILEQFNISATIATPEEIESIKKIKIITGQSYSQDIKVLFSNAYLLDYWTSEIFFPDIRDILLKEFTLKNLSPNAEAWKNKILSADCAVSMHVRHGDFLYVPQFTQKPWFQVPPLEYYCNCLNLLKEAYNNPMVFIFSNNMSWCKENLRLDVPTEFVDGWQENEKFDMGAKRDVEEIYLMSLCKHNINPRSAFSWWGAYLNQNPDKKVFISRFSTAEQVKNYRYSLATKTSVLDSGKWITVPFYHDKQPDITMQHIFSLLLVVNNDVETISNTLDSLLGQDYKYYEVIIIDNASTDGSDKICRQAIVGKKNVTYKRLRKKVSNATAWNRAFKYGTGKYVFFLKGNECLLTNALKTLMNSILIMNTNEVCSFFSWLEENEQGTIAFADKKYSAQRDTRFKDEKRAVVMGTDGQAAAKLLLDGQINRFLGTKIYNREFLKDNGIKFDEHLADNEAEIFFQIEAFFKSKYFMHISNAFYVAPKA